MKTMLIIILSLMSSVVWANEVISVNGQKMVLLKIETVRALDSVLKGHGPAPQAIEKIQAILRTELIRVSGQESFCDTAMKVYASRNATPVQVQQKCIETITSKNFPKELVQDPPEYRNLAEFREALSGYLALLILMN